MDHAGIATQAKVEEKLRNEGKSRYDLGREKFVEETWKWKEEYASHIRQQWSKLGLGLDYNRERFTLDEGLSKAVREVFVSLYNKGLIYRGEYIINWDPSTKTALSDIEVIHKDVQGAFYHMRYPLADGSGHIEIATTRPETMLGDTAVAVHPEDERYKHLIGKTVKLPIVGREIPIVADDYVDMEFGSGAVKITPAVVNFLFILLSPFRLCLTKTPERFGTCLRWVILYEDVLVRVSRFELCELFLHFCMFLDINKAHDRSQ